MSDDRLRWLERRWEATRAAEDGEAYLEALRRVGAPDERQRPVRGRWGVRGSYSEAEVLARLDHAADGGFGFPPVNPFVLHPAEFRLTAYRDQARWALVAEGLGVDPATDDLRAVATLVYTVGNCLRPARTGPGARGENGAGEGSGRRAALDVIRPLALGPLGSARDVHIRGEPVALRLAPGVEQHELLRGLLVAHRDWLLATPDERRAHLPADLPLFLTLEGGRVPLTTGEELPSQSAAFQALAAALVEGEPSRYAPPAPAPAQVATRPA